MSRDINKLEKLSKDLGVVVDKLNLLCKQHEGYTALWEVAVRQGDGISEGANREKLHTLTDQILDARADSIQLQKTYGGL